MAVAVALHVLVIGLLSVQWTPGERRFDNPPMEVDLIADTAPQSTAPVISDSPPAARLGEEDAVDIAAPEPMPTPTPPLPTPVARPAPAPTPTPKAVVRPTPAPSPKPVAKAPPAPPKKATPAIPKAAPKAAPKAPTKQGTARPTGRLDGIAEGLSRSQPKAPASKGAPAAATSAEVKRSIDVSIKAKVSPKWDSCRISGVDVDQLVTTVKFKLSQSGALAGYISVATKGVNDSNKFQVERHQECAKKAIQLASPFDLDPESYDFWKEYTLHLNKK
jgi:protein TonB